MFTCARFVLLYIRIIGGEMNNEAGKTAHFLDGYGNKMILL